MLDRLKRFKKDPFSSFVENQSRQNREVRFASGVQQKMIERFGKELPAFINHLDNSLRDFPFGILSFVTQSKKDPSSWFSPSKIPYRAKVVINITNFPQPGTPEYTQEIEKIKQEVKRYKEVEEKPTGIEIEPVEGVSKPEAVTPEAKPGPTLLPREDAGGYFEKGRELAKRGDLEGAIRYFRKAFEENPNDPIKRYQLVLALEIRADQCENYEDHRKYFDQAMDVIFRSGEFNQEAYHRYSSLVEKARACGEPILGFNQEEFSGLG